jgi:NAD(P)-dependent dehydrogenase (short-subunit alcohol dehydrogenase family)
VIITGATGGIGAASAHALSARGARLTLVDVSSDRLDELVAELGAERAVGVVADVSDSEQMVAAAAAAIDRYGRIDVVFANAGITLDPPATIATSDPIAYERVIEVNLLGVVRTVRACLPAIAATGGHVLGTSSIYAFANGVANSAYAASNAGVEAYLRALRAELAHTGATAGVLYPGWVETPIADSSHGGDEIATRIVDRGFRGKWGVPVAPEQIAAAVVKGIERRSARIFEPKRWASVSALRGVVNRSTDRRLDRDSDMHELVSELERRRREP